MIVDRCKSIDEALVTARELIAAQGYDWFRGQVRPYPPVASFYRLDAQQRVEAKHAIAHFVQWARKTPGLDRLCVDELIAIGQHHGLKTPFLDFSTTLDVAAFFACYTDRPPKDNEFSRLYLLNSNEVIHFFESVRKWSPGIPPTELIKPDVPELWRLTAQRGVFLFTGGPDFEKIYDLDFLEFPYTGKIAHPTAKDIFPDRSSLEKPLTHFFTLDQQRKNFESFPDLREKFHVVSLESRYENAVVPEHPSWKLIGSQWQALSKERLRSGFETFRLDIDLALSPRTLKQRVAYAVSAILDEHPYAREEGAMWEVIFESTDSKQLLNDILMDIWDGSRHLAYEDDDLAECLAVAVALFAAGYGRDNNVRSDNAANAAYKVMDQPLAVGFTASDGIGGYGHVSAAAIVKALRVDLEDVLAAAGIPYSSDSEPMGLLSELFMNKNDPRCLFEFKAFASEFAKSALPSQVVLRYAKHPLIFAASEITVFGLP